MKRLMVAFGVSMLIASAPAYANLNQQMSDMFGSLANSTAPQSYKGQMMGVMSGGSMYARNRIVNANAIGFVPPHMTAGCGGLDMFGGSFSFINAAQFQQLLRSVASNASGYFFQIALQAMCPTCMDQIASLQKGIQHINDMMSNSCQIGKTLVDSTLEQIPPDVASSSAKLGTLKDLATKRATVETSAFTDSFDAIGGVLKEGVVSKVSKVNPSYMNKFSGNIAWYAMRHSNMTAWLSRGDDHMLEAFMSMTGTSIVTPDGSVTPPAGGTEKAMKDTTLAPTLDFGEFLNGAKQKGTVNIYTCLDKTASPVEMQCLTVTSPNSGTPDPNFKGFAEMVEDTLVGTGGANGIVQKMGIGIGQTFTPTEKAFLDNTPAPILTLIRQIAINDKDTAVSFAREAAPIIATEMASRLVDDILRAVKMATTQIDSAHTAAAEAFLKTLSGRAKELYAQRMEIQQQNSRFTQMFQTFQAARAVTLANRKVSEDLRPPVAGSSR